MYPILENNRDYTDWIIKITCQFKSKECERVIDVNCKEINVVGGDADITLYKAQQNHMFIVLERVLQTTDGIRLTRKYHNIPQKIGFYMRSINVD